MQSTNRKSPGDLLTARQLTSIGGEPISVPSADQLIHLQFRRFAGCPLCDLHLRSIARRVAELEAAKVREVVVFHSSSNELRDYAAHELPFPVLADPSKHLYSEFGVESAPRALTDPRVWGSILRAVTASLWLIVRGESPLRLPSGDGGRLGLPADFLIDRGGRVLACKYGEHAYDQWSVDEVLALAKAEASPPKTTSAQTQSSPGFG